MPRIVDAFLVKQPSDLSRPAGVSAAQPQAFMTISFPTLVEIHPVCQVRAKRSEFGHSYPLTLDVTDGDGFPVQAQVRTAMFLDVAKRTSLEGVESVTLPCPSQRLIIHEAGTYRLVLHMEGSPSFVVPFELRAGDTKSPDEPAHVASPAAAKA
jgi:hypothetical protein